MMPHAPPAPHAALAALLLLLPSCRDSVDPFRPGQVLPDTGLVVQLTRNTGHDRDPVWSRAGDTIYYAAEGFPGLPGGAGVLARIPAGGGTVQPLFPELQGAAQPRWFATPAVSGGGDRLAYFELIDVFASLPPSPSPTCLHPEPVLGAARLHVRQLGPTAGAPDATIHVSLPGRDARQDSGFVGPYFVQTLPFQRMYLEERRFLFRPSWSPDGARLVFSDGVRLLLWEVGAAAATAIPGTADGVSPAWSPDGQLIAFTHLERGDSTVSTCNVAVGRDIELQMRTGYAPGPARLVLIRPDGTGRVELGEGLDPAWSSDGQQLFFVRDGSIFRSARDGSGAVQLGNTVDGRSPAVSSDGSRIAFARTRSGTHGYDLWVVTLR